MRVRAITMVGWLLLAGCFAEEMGVVHFEGEGAWAMVRDAPIAEEEVVAVVDGRRISAVELRLIWEENPQWSAEEAIAAVVEREVLMAEALEREVHLRPEVSFARKQGLVQALLADEVEGKAEIDDEKREPFSQMVEERRRAPAGLRASHLVILVSEDEAASEEEVEQVWERARELAEEARSALGEYADDDALRGKAKEINEMMEVEGLSAAVNEHLRFPRVNERFSREQLPKGWTTVVGEFAEGAETVAGDERLGRLSEPIRSSFGWHLIRVDERLDERSVEPAMRRRFVEEQLLLDAQVQRFGQEMQRWVEEAKVQIFEERLEDETMH